MEAKRYAESGTDTWERDLAHLLGELSDVQKELLEVLKARGERMAQNDFQDSEQLDSRTEQLVAKLRDCQDRRSSLLASNREAGRPAATLGKLANRAGRERRDSLVKQVKDSSRRMRLLQHHSLANWVLAQRTLLHLAQMLEIIATGGRLQATYGSGASTASPGGALVDQEA